MNPLDNRIDDFLVYYHRFWLEMRSLKIEFKEELPSELGMLIEAGYYENQPLSTIADQTKISRSQITAIIEALVKQGMVKRVTDEKDRRIKRVIFTPKGREIREKYLEAFEKNWNQKLSSLSPEEFEELYKSIETIKKVSLKIQ